ncbi:MAG TPA: hypothetical protein VGD37_29010 [Kofleriaceae bacterium]
MADVGHPAEKIIATNAIDLEPDAGTELLAREVVVFDDIGHALQLMPSIRARA